MDSLANDTQQIIQTYLIPWGINIISAAFIFIVGRIIVNILVRIINQLMKKARVDETLRRFLRNITSTVLMLVVAIAVLDQLGVNTNSVLAIFATAGLAVGLALKDQLSNFAAGVMLIMFKPFKTGDFIEAAGTSGVVERILIFNTVMRTGDNREITVPNAHIYSGNITNVTARDTRRIDMVIGIGYDDDIQQAKQILETILAADDRILKDPAPAISVAELGESSIDLAVRPWVNSGDYWAVRSDFLESVKREFDSKGISIPYPQRDIHVHQVAA